VSMPADGTEAILYCWRDLLGNYWWQAMTTRLIYLQKCHMQDDVATAALLLNCAGVQRHLFPLLAAR
jgi:hypothetical protein